jgi:sortase A
VIELFKLDDYLLPGGHVIDAKGNVEFNFDELFAADVPDHLQSSAIAQAFAINLVRPEKTTETALQVFIPALNIDATIVQGSDWEALKLGVGQVQNGANPGDATGNVALAAHNDVFGNLFADIKDLQVGDDIQVQTATETYTYHVTGWEIVRPTDVRVLEDQGKPTVTLISCYPLGVNDRRYVIYADREDVFRRQEG